MAQRITQKFLEVQVARLNQLTNSPPEYFSAGTRDTQPGHYCLDGAYDGWVLHRISNKLGGANDIFNCGHIPASRLSDLIRAYSEGFKEGTLKSFHPQ